MTATSPSCLTTTARSRLSTTPPARRRSFLERGERGRGHGHCRRAPRCAVRGARLCTRELQEAWLRRLGGDGNRVRFLADRAARVGELVFRPALLPRAPAAGGRSAFGAAAVW